MHSQKERVEALIQEVLKKGAAKIFLSKEEKKGWRTR